MILIMQTISYSLIFALLGLVLVHSAGVAITSAQGDATTSSVIVR